MNDRFSEDKVRIWVVVEEDRGLGASVRSGYVTEQEAIEAAQGSHEYVEWVDIPWSRLELLKPTDAARTVVWRTDLPPDRDESVWLCLPYGNVIPGVSTSLCSHWGSGVRWAYDADARRALGLGESNVPGVGPGAAGETKKED